MKRQLFLVLFAFSSLFGQTITEKKESFKKNEQDMDDDKMQELREVNSLLEVKQFELCQLYERAYRLYQEKGDERRYLPLLTEIKSLRKEIEQIEKMWKDEAASFSLNEEYSLWHQPETTLQQLVMDYGVADFIYLIPPEIANLRLSLSSAIPIPRESWGECLELILNQYGIGFHQLNPYLRELYVLSNDQTEIKAIIDDASKLDFFSPSTRLCFILSPSGADPKSDLRFLQKFSNPASTNIEVIGGKIFITATASTIQELLKLFTFANAATSMQEYHLATLSKINAKEMEIILLTAFHDGKIGESGSSLRVIPLHSLNQSLFLSGSKDDIKKALKLIKEVEAQIEDPQEKTVFWYTAKHSDAEELATVLAKVYDLLIENKTNVADVHRVSLQNEKKKEDSGIVPAISVGPKSDKKVSHKTADGQNNFIVDPKTGSIIMVVEQEALPKIKELLKKLDVPKKMVQLEVLLFEKKVSNQSKCGLNLLRLGSTASQISSTALNWNAVSMGAGILEFLISRNKGSGIPAYDLAYQFLLGQEDVQINASPSVTTMNQTPATIAVVEEISIDAGADDKKSRIFHRAQYGITIQITPTINLEESEDMGEGEGFITLETDITFDTTKNNADSRPDVTRRHIKNHVRIADGQTLILGGLRRKNTQDNKDSLPFLGEIPGIGKLFSHTEMSDSSTEMFVFITPKIIADPIQDAEKIRKEELKKRPGDLPEFLHELQVAKGRQKKRLFEKSLTALFGRESFKDERGQPIREYDGR